MAPQQRERELAATVLAFAAHAGVLLLALALAPSRSVSVPAVDPRAERWFDLELEPVVTGARPSGIAHAAAPGAERAPTPRPAEGGASTRDETEAPAPPVAGAGSAAPSAQPADEYGGPNRDPVLTLPPGAGGLPVWSIPGAVAGPGPATAAPTSAAPPRATDRDMAGQVLRGTVGGTDSDKGLAPPAGGIAGRAIEDAARRLTLPHDCRASFEVRVGANGEVLGVRVLSSSAGDASAWERVASSAASALASKRSNMAARMRRGATIVVRLESRYVYPSGSPDRSYSDIGANKSDYFSSTVTVTMAGDKPLPPGPVQRIDQRSPYSKALPTHVAPVEMKPLLPDR